MNKRDKPKSSLVSEAANKLYALGTILRVLNIEYDMRKKYAVYAYSYLKMVGADEEKIDWVYQNYFNDNETKGGKDDGSRRIGNQLD